MKLKDMRPDQVKRANECESAEEFREFCVSEGIELTDDELETIAGGHFDKNVFVRLFGVV